MRRSAFMFVPGRYSTVAEAALVLGGDRYVLTKPRLPYKAIEVTFTILYFACVVALVLVVPFAFTAVIQGDASLAMTSTAFIFILAGVAWASLSAYSSAFHALRLACGDA